MNSSTEITATSPVGTGTVDVRVVTFGGFSPTTTADEFTYQESPPAITAFSIVSLRVHQAATYTIFATGAPFPTFSVSSGTLPAGITLTNVGNGQATLSGTPAANTEGPWPITVTATNADGSATKNITLEVDQAPQFTSPNTATFTKGVAGSFTVTTTGSWPEPVTLSGGSAFPLAGLTFTDNGNGTATISGTPTKSETKAVTIAAKNVVLESTQLLTITINP